MKTRPEDSDAACWQGLPGRLCVQAPTRVLLGAGLGWGPSGAHAHPTPWPDMLVSTGGGHGTGSQQLLVLTDQMGAQRFVGLGVKNTLLASKNRRDLGQWQ